MGSRPLQKQYRQLVGQRELDRSYRDETFRRKRELKKEYKRQVMDKLLKAGQQGVFGGQNELSLALELLDKAYQLIHQMHIGKLRSDGAERRREIGRCMQAFEDAFE